MLHRTKLAGIPGIVTVVLVFVLVGTSTSAADEFGIDSPGKAYVNGTYQGDYPDQISMKEGEQLEIKNITTKYPDNDGDRTELRVTIEPPLPSGTNLPVVVKTDSGSLKFTATWIPNHYAAGDKDYEVTLVPYLDGEPADPDGWRSFTLTITDALLITYPQDYFTAPAGEFMEFSVATDGYYGPKPHLSPVTMPSKRAKWAPLSNTLCWPTIADDAGKYHEFIVEASTDGDPVVASILIGVLPEDGNLVINPDMEFGDDGPDGWTKSTDPPPTGLKLGWFRKGGYLRATRSFPDADGSASSEPDWHGWEQNVYLTPSGEDSVDDQAVYEFKCTYRLLNACLGVNSEGIGYGKSGMGVILQFFTHDHQLIQSAYRAQLLSYDAGFRLWNDADGCYHGRRPIRCPKQTYTCYVKAPIWTRYIKIRTVTMTQGELRVYHCSLREVPEDEGQTIPSFMPWSAERGEVSLLRNRAGEPVFIIGLTKLAPLGEPKGSVLTSDPGDPPDPDDAEGVPLTYKELAELGFNAAEVAQDGTLNDLRPVYKRHADSGLYGLGRANCIPYLRKVGDEYQEGYSDGVTNYYGLEKNQESAELLKGAVGEGVDILLIEGPDESNYRVSKDGAPDTLNPTRSLREFGYTISKVEEDIQDAFEVRYMFNIMPRDWDVAMDRPHARLTDVVSFTWNCPAAYSCGPNAYSRSNVAAKMGRVGEFARRYKHVTRAFNGDTPKPALGFCLGVRQWAKWNPSGDSTTRVPFHLQRFQVYDQIVNGACGIRFYCSGSDSLRLNLVSNQDDRAFWGQIVQIVGELDALYDVLVEPDFDNTKWTADQPIEAMYKEPSGHNAKIYLIATSPSEHPLDEVTITLPDVESIRSVKALFENDDTNTNYGEDALSDGIITNEEVGQICRRGRTDIGWAGRTIDPDGNSFSDTFIDYAVHVYEIELEPNPQQPDRDGDLSDK